MSYGQAETISGLIQNLSVRATPPPVIWQSWGKWSTCSKTCGSGTKTRRRYSDNYQKSERSDPEPCYLQACPKVLFWSSWGAWSPCSKTCDLGIKTRTRCLSDRSNCERSDPQNCIERVCLSPQVLTPQNNSCILLNRVQSLK